MRQAYFSEFVGVGHVNSDPHHIQLYSLMTQAELLFLSCSPNTSGLWPRTGSLRVFNHDILWAQGPACCDSEMVIFYRIFAVIFLNNLHITWYKQSVV